jgi:fengycin family lipopeptide synthetase E
MLTKENVKTVYGLTPMQEGILLDFAKNPQSTAYVEQFDFCLQGDVNADAVQKSFAALIHKYDVLRSLFSFKKTDRPKQIVLKQWLPQLNEVDYSYLSDLQIEDAWSQFKEQDRQKSFNLSQEQLIRLSLVKLGSNKSQLLLTFHHIILDGWCFSQLLGDFFGYYDTFCNHPNAQITQQESVPFSDYIRWIEQQDPSHAERYWKETLADYSEDVGIPFYDRPFNGELGHADFQFSLGNTLTNQVKALAKQLNVTVNSIFQTTWGLLIQKLNQVDDVVFGHVVSGRSSSLAHIESIMGLFINTQATRLQSSENDPYQDLVQKLHQHSIKAKSFEYYPLSQIQSHSELKNRLINHVITFENLPINEQVKQMTADSDLLNVYDVDVFQAAKFDFHVIVYPGDELNINFVFNPNRYTESEMASLSRSFVNLFEMAVLKPQSKISELELCSPIDQQLVLQQFNNSTNETYPRDSFIAELFLQQVSQTPTAIAVKYADVSFSYQQLEQLIQQATADLLEKGVTPGDRVALLMPRCPEMVIGMLAILYCGASYVPMETTASPERIQLMLEDANASVIVTTLAYSALLPNGIQSLALDAEKSNKIQTTNIKPIDRLAMDEAYIMYTSGSTGKPKGCAISQRNVIRLVKNTNYVDLQPKDNILQTGAPAFDASTFEVWGSLLNGATLCLVDESTIVDARALKQSIQSNQISHMWLTSALFNQLCESNIELFSRLQVLLVGGDVLSVKHIELVRTAHPHLEIINGYGPTENTTFSATCSINQTYVGKIPIGKPIAHSTAYILDKQGRILPSGAVGELCVGGDGVAIGYLNRTELNKEKFFEHVQLEERLYRTGDLARWQLDGNIDLLGRNDNQVKIRGFRVELGEIEKTMACFPAIKEAVVIAAQCPLDQEHLSENGKQLYAFYISDETLEASAIRRYLSQYLPHYMLPMNYLKMDHFPLTINGKVDKNALPLETCAKQVSASLGAKPRNPTEKQVAEICKQVLGVVDIGIDDNFFEVGANSLNLIAINNRLNAEFNEDIPVTVMFEYTTVAGLSQYLTENEALTQEKQASEQQALEQAKNTLSRTRKLMRNLDEI